MDITEPEDEGGGGGGAFLIVLDLEEPGDGGGRERSDEAEAERVLEAVLDRPTDAEDGESADPPSRVAIILAGKRML